MDFLPQSIQTLMEELSRLPGLGPKTAQRLAFHLLKVPVDRRERLGKAVLHLEEGVNECQSCFALTTDSPCKICANPARDQGLLCVVETTLDLLAIEKTGEFKGVYHVLQGKLSPLDGVGTEDIRLEELFARVMGAAETGGAVREAGPEVNVAEGLGEAGGLVSRTPIREVIMALNPDLEGDTTGLFIQRKLAGLSATQVSRIARGIPSGGHLEYTDDATLIRALEGRQRI